MTNALKALCLLSLLVFLSFPAKAQQSQDFGDFVVHFTAIKTDQIPPEVARGYNIKRSDGMALLNITVLKKVMNTPGTPVRASATASATNLTGQRRDILLREVSEPGSDKDRGAVYYIGEFRVHNRETFDITIDLKPEGEEQSLQVNFRQQFFVD